MKEFKVGDRIRYIGVDKDYSGKCGTIIVVDNSVNLLPYGVKFDERIAMGHDLNEQCEDGYGLWVGAGDIKLVYSTLEGYTDQELKDELKRRKDKERIEVIEELRKYIDKPVHLHEIHEYSFNFEFMLNDEDFNTYCKNRTTDELKKDLKLKKENKINEILKILNNNIKKLRELGYTIPYKDNTTIDSLELNEALDSIGVFYE